MRSGMLILPQAREALALRGGDQRRAGVHPYGGSGRGVVSAGRAALPEPFAVRRELRGCRGCVDQADAPCSLRTMRKG